MANDDNLHPSERSEAGTVNSDIGIRALREAIPGHCFKPLYKWAFWYTGRDIALVAGWMYFAATYVPYIETTAFRWTAWAIYGYVQGLLMTGIWVVGHEAGHGALFPAEWLNSLVGFVLHSYLFTPFFSWQSSHRRHHIYANNLKKDLVFVPPKRDSYVARLSIQLERLDEVTEDSPLFTLVRIVLQQLIGWPWYLLTNITASPDSLEKSRLKGLLSNGHFLPSSSLFRPEEASAIMLSNAGLVAMGAILHACGRMYGWSLVAALYFVPYLWVNHWIVAITYLHHTHPDVPKYEDGAWSYLKGATSTVDRDLGFVGKYIFHDVADYHVIHHIFPRIPFYYGREATAAIKPMLGKYYREERGKSFVYALWETFTKCQWVEVDDPSKAPEDQKMCFKGGPSPPPVMVMN